MKSNGEIMNQSDRAKGHQKGLARRREIALKRAERARQMLNDGFSVSKIAEHFGVNRRTIQKDLKEGESDA